MSLIKFFERIWFSRWKGEPHHQLKKDYETLIKLSRRCAYDLRHAVEHIPRDHYYITEFGFRQRATMWIDLFAKGNPGKDYRHEMQRDIENLLVKVEKLQELCRANGVEVPDDLRDDDIPFGR